jgi:hypothetical protein
MNMAVVFGKQNAQSAAKSVVDTVFARETVVLDESEGDAAPATGQIRVITNYRGYTSKGPGRKNAMLGQTVIDLSALSVIALSDMPNLIARLTALQAELSDAGL